MPEQIYGKGRGPGLVEIIPLMTIVPTPSTTTAASVIASSKLAAGVITVATALMSLPSGLMVATVTAKGGAILRALLAMHLVVQMAWITPKRLLILVRQWWRKTGLTGLTGHVGC